MFKRLKTKTKETLTKVGAFIEATVEIIGEGIDDFPDLDFD
jgi:hypothetical protein